MQRRLEKIFPIWLVLAMSMQGRPGEQCGDLQTWWVLTNVSTHVADTMYRTNMRNNSKNIALKIDLARLMARFLLRVHVDELVSISHNSLPLFLVIGIKGLHLPLPDEATALTCTLNNGIHFVTTPECELGPDCRIDQEFELYVIISVCVLLF